MKERKTSIPTYETAEGVVGKIRKRIADNCNSAHGWRAEYIRTGQEHYLQKIEQLEPEVMTLLDEFEVTESHTHPNPTWIPLALRASWEVAKGDDVAALNLDLAGWEQLQDQADPLKRKARAAANIAGILRRLHRFDEALTWADRAWKEDPGHPVYALELALCLFRCSLLQDCDKILQICLDHIGRTAYADMLSSVIPYERELKEIPLQSAQQLLNQTKV